MVVVVVVVLEEEEEVGGGVKGEKGRWRQWVSEMVPFAPNTYTHAEGPIIYLLMF